MTTISLVKSGCICVLLAFSTLLSKGQLSANFSATPVSGCAPLLVSFSDISTGNPTQWKWDLGNGTISYLQNPSVTYFNPGQYTIKLVVQNSSGTDSIIRTGYITIHGLPSINFISSNVTGCAPLSAQFTDLSNPVSGTSVLWEWDFGDGNTSNLQHPSHTYTSPGNYNVSLRVTNSNGCSNTITRNQFIQVSSGINADFSYTVGSGCTLPVNVNFQNLTTGSGILSYLWDFGDGTTSVISNPQHQYTAPGTYTVQLIVTNNTGCSDTIKKIDEINIGSVNAAINSPDTVCVNAPVLFENNSVPNAVSSVWNFGDGTTSALLHPVKSFITPGIYTVTLISDFGGCQDSTSKNIVVSGKPMAGFSANNVSACSIPMIVQFTNTSAGATSYYWNFGDGNSSTLPAPSHTYTGAGTYSVSLITFNASGCSDTLIRNNYINLQIPEVTINQLPAEGCAPFSWTFSSSTNSNDPVSTYLWDFGDGTTSVLQNPTHVFAAGTYNISLVITTESGCTDSSVIINGIRAGIKPQAGFSANPRNACASTPIQFTDETSGNPDRWLWLFGDGGTSTLQNPQHVYEDTGYFQITLITWNNGCPDTLVIPDYIHIDPPIALFTTQYNCINRLTATFTDQSIGADTWHWSFGDGNTSTQQNPVHTYSATGIYQVVLTVTNLQSGCSYQKSREVWIINESPAFNASDTVICRNDEITFLGLASPGMLSTYEWNFGDGTAGSGHSLTHIYTTPGSYTVSLIITDKNGCRDTLVKPQYIKVNGPTANFGVASGNECSMSLVSFSDSSLTDGTHSISTWTWNYGDGNSETLTGAPFNHTYSSPGLYSVSLTVTDNSGCTDMITRDNLLTVSHPTASFTADTSICLGMNSNFVNTSEGTGLIYAWSFGDGNIGTSANPVHTYNTSGQYTVGLVVTDQFGCADTLTRNNYINVADPIVSFAVSDTFGTCPPLIVNFTNQSSGYTSLNWDFGDGTFSTANNPSHFYSTPGTYQSSLTITGPGGCTRTKEQQIVVLGPSGSFSYNDTEGCNPFTVVLTATTRNRISFVWDFNDGTTISTSDSVISHTYTTPGYYLPKMILVDAGGCTVAVTGSDTIKVHGVTAGFNFSQQVLCNSGNVQFNNTTTSSSPITGYLWKFGDGSQSTLQNPVHTYTTTGTFIPMLIVTLESGCIDSISSSVPVRVSPAPVAQIQQTENGCVPVSAAFQASATGVGSSFIWQWQFGNGNSSDLVAPPVQTYLTAGDYTVKLIVTDSLGCRDTVSTIISAYPVPNVNAGGDVTICEGTSQQLSASGANNYSWQNAGGLSCYDCSSPMVNPASATQFVVTGTNNYGCSDTDTVAVNVIFPFEMRSSAGDTLCEGNSLRLLAAGAHSYEWSPSTGLSNSSVPNPLASPSVSTTYRVIGKDAEGCFRDTAYIPVTVFPIPQVEAGNDVTINVGEITDLTPTISPDVTGVTWTPTGSIFRTTYPSITVKPRETTMYTVEVENAGGCRSRDNLTVFVLCNDANVFIPNTFSPNGDGSNDVFYPRGTGLFSIKSTRIYNRWGEVVFEKSNFQANNPSFGWDGRHKGVALNPDVFVFVIEIICDNNTVLPYKGNVALIR